MGEDNLRPPAADEPVIKVLLADDEEMSRRGFGAALEEIHGIRLVGTTRLGAGLRHLVQTARPDVVLLNAATAYEWRGSVQAVTGAATPGRPEVIVVTRTDLQEVLHAVQAGATGVLFRDVSAEELSFAIRHVAAGQAVISPAATSCLLAPLRSLVGGVGGGHPGTAAIAMLSRRERQILAGLAAGWSNQEIAAHTRLTVATVKSHVSRILTKLDVRDRVQAALLGLRAGIMVEMDFTAAGSEAWREKRAG